MRKFYVSIPYSVDLCREDGWSHLDNRHTRFFIARCHFMVRERPAGDRPRHGEILAVHAAPEHVELRKVISIEQERQATHTEESLRRSLCEDEAVIEYAVRLAAELRALPPGRLTSEVKAGSTHTLKTSFLNSFRMERTVSRKEVVKFELTYTIMPEAVREYVSVAMYQRYAWDIYLAYVDYLYVDYKKSVMGLRKKRRKRPDAGTRERPNVIRLNVPLASVVYWKLLPRSAVMMDEAAYQNEVEDPCEISVEPPHSRHEYHVEMPDVPSLYQLSNVAFPLRWIKREGPWTEDELKKIEWEDAEGSAWWFQYGPGRS